MILKQQKIFFLLVLLVFTISSNIMAQPKGEVEIVRDDKVDLLVSKHVLINQNQKGIEGYRIQIFFDSGSNSKSRAQSVYESFRAKYPGTGAYLTFKTPNYKVRVGDFRTKLDAQRFLNELLGDYPNAWITSDVINLPKTE
ncbi:MAG: SPOR domain-containing protein [Syntrophothermus sp.]